MALRNAIQSIICLVAILQITPQLPTSSPSPSAPITLGVSPLELPIAIQLVERLKPQKVALVVKEVLHEKALRALNAKEVEFFISSFPPPIQRFFAWAKSRIANCCRCRSAIRPPGLPKRRSWESSQRPDPEANVPGAHRFID